MSFGASTDFPYSDGDSWRRYLRLEVRLLCSGQYISWRYIKMKKDLAERGPISGLTVPANPRWERQLCTFAMHCKINRVLWPQTNASLMHLLSTPASTSLICSFSAYLVLSFLFLAVHFQALLTSTVWGGSWSRQGSSQVQAAVGCCFPRPRWWQMSPHLCKESLQSASPTAPLRRTFKLSQALFIQEVSLRSRSH